MAAVDVLLPHDAVFYRDDGHLLDATSTWLNQQLESGCAALVIATPAHRQGFTNALTLLGPAYGAACRVGRAAMLDAETTLARFMQADGPDASLFRSTVGDALRSVRHESGPTRRVAAYGEMVSLLCGRRQAAWAVRLEQLWNDLLVDGNIALRCGYSLADLQHHDGRMALDDICHAHVQTTALRSRAPAGGLVGASQADSQGGD